MKEFLLLRRLHLDPKIQRYLLLHLAPIDHRLTISASVHVIRRLWT